LKSQFHSGFRQKYCCTALHCTAMYRLAYKYKRTLPSCKVQENLYVHVLVCVFIVSMFNRRMIFGEQLSPPSSVSPSRRTNILRLFTINACIPMLSMPCHTVVCHYRSFFVLRYSILLYVPPTRCIICFKSSVRCRSRPWRPKQSSQQPA
jgi:hypothetical protein